MLSPGKVLDDLLAANQTLAYEAAVVIGDLLQQRETLIKEQIRAEMEYEAGHAVWRETSGAMLKALQSVDPNGDNAKIRAAKRMLRELNKRLLPS